MSNALQSWFQQHLFSGNPLPAGLERLLGRPEIYNIDGAHVRQVVTQNYCEGGQFLQPDDPQVLAWRLMRRIPHGATQAAYLQMLFECPQALPAVGLEYLGDFAKAALEHPELGPLLVSHQASILRPEDTAMWRTGESSESQVTLLVGILTAVQTMHRTGGRPVVIIDLDDTSLLTPPRQAAIFSEFARQGGVDQMLGIRPRHFSGFGYTDALVNGAGLDAAWFARNGEDLKRFWLGRFFSSPYLLLDTPAPGVVDYLCSLQAAGAAIVYLTGRDAVNMRVGTEAALRLHGFPYPDEGRVMLIMKVEDNQTLQAGMDETARRAAVRCSDLAYKQRAIARAQRRGTVVAAIDNEASMVNLFQKELPQARVLRVDTIQTRAEPLADGVGLIGGFRI